MSSNLAEALADKRHRLAPAELGRLVADARSRTLSLVDDLEDGRLDVPRLPIVNPPLWELGHVAHFYEMFVLRLLDDRRASTGALLEGADEMYDSFRVAHEDRWSLPLPSRAGTLDYMARVQELVLGRLEDARPDPRETYLYLLATLHEDMHGEALTYTRQTLSCPPLTAGSGEVAAIESGPLPGDVEVPGGPFLLGAERDEPFVFDNEKWAHPVELAPFRIARAPVTNEEFAAFVDAGGYGDDRWWSYEGRVWRNRTQARHPVYWTRVGPEWRRRAFDRLVPLHPHAPVLHVCWYEAEAYCRWSGRRLPTEAEWELAASAEYGGRKRRYPWGDEPPSPERANLDGRRAAPVDVAAFPEGDSALGCRQMIGNVWEWTASAFYPYPGYVVDFPYREYSAPWFGYHKVLRGGAFATRSRLVRNTYRNFFLPDRRDVLAGFRTCAV